MMLLVEHRPCGTLMDDILMDPLIDRFVHSASKQVSKQQLLPKNDRFATENCAQCTRFY